MMMPNQNMFAARAGLPMPAGSPMMTAGPMSLPPGPGMPGPGMMPPMTMPPRPMPPQMGGPQTGGPTIAQEGPGMVPPGPMPPQMRPPMPMPGGPDSGPMPWRGGMPMRPRQAQMGDQQQDQGPQNFMRQRMGLM